MTVRPHKMIFVLLSFWVSWSAFFCKPVFAADQIRSQTIQEKIAAFVERLYLAVPGSKSGKVVLHQAWLAHQRQTMAPWTITTRFTVDAHAQQKSLISVSGELITGIEAGKTTQVHAQLEGTALAQSAASTFDVFFRDRKIWVRFTRLPDLEVLQDRALLNTWWWLEEQQETASQAEWTLAQQNAFATATAELLERSTLSSAKKMKKNDHDVFVVEVGLPKTAVVEYLAQVYAVQTSGDFVAPIDPRPAMDAVFTRLAELQAVIWVDQSSYRVRHLELPWVYTPAENTLQVSQLFGTMQIDIDGRAMQGASPAKEERGQPLLPMLKELQSGIPGGMVK